MAGAIEVQLKEWGTGRTLRRAVANFPGDAGVVRIETEVTRSSTNPLEINLSAN